MRAATLFKRLPRLGGQRVVGVELIEDAAGAERVMVEVALRCRRATRCSGCQLARVAYHSAR